MLSADYKTQDVQNSCNEGNVEMTNLLVFNFNGEKIYAGVNYARSWTTKLFFASRCFLRS